MTDSGNNDTSFFRCSSVEAVRTVSRRKHGGGLCENHSWGETPMRMISCHSSAGCENTKINNKTSTVA